MATIAQKRDEFRQYLESSGVVNALTRALIKLYEESEKPENAVTYLRQAMCETCKTEQEFIELEEKYTKIRSEMALLQRDFISLKGNLKRSESHTEKLETVCIDELLGNEKHNSLLKKYLTKEYYQENRDKKTKFDSVLLDCIQSGLENIDSGVGLYAADYDCYSTFDKIFNSVIEDYHIGFTGEMTHPPMDWGITVGDENSLDLSNLDEEGAYIVSTRVRCARSLADFPFNPRMTESQYLELMNRVKAVLESLDGDLQGVFHELINMTPAHQEELIQTHFLFKEGDRFLQSAQACRFWPVGRGIFYNKTKTFLCWINEEDHLRFISMQPGADLMAVYFRLYQAVTLLGEKLDFFRTERLGFATFCPTNLGTTIRASVHIKLPKLSANPEKLKEFANKYNLQIRGVHGEHSEADDDGTLDISNKRRLGLTEVEVIKEMHSGIAELIATEKEL